MKLHRITLVLSEDDETLNEAKSYTWVDGDKLTQLAWAIQTLQIYEAERQDALRTALASQNAIDVPSPS